MRPRIITGIVLTAAVFSFSLAAQEAEERVLTLQEAVDLANQNNITIKSAQGNLDLLKSKNSFSWNSISPTIKVAGSFADNFESDTTTFGVSGTVSMGLSTNLISTINGAKLAYESGQLSYEQTCRKIEQTVRKTFYGLLYEEASLESQKKALETAKSQYEANQEKFRHGQISELDVMQSRVTYEQKLPSLESAALQLSNDYRTFKQLIGLDQKIKLELNGSLDDVMKLKSVTLPDAAQPAPDVRSAQYDVDTAKNNLLASRFSAYGPAISASYSYGKNKISSMDDWTTSNSLSVGVSIPLDGYLPWSTGAASIAASKVSLKNAQLQLENTETTLLINTENYIQKINQGISQLASLKATAELAEQSYKMTQTAYNYGKTDLMNLQSASDNVFSSEVNIKSQCYSLIGTLLDLEYLLGIPFGSLGE